MTDVSFTDKFNVWHPRSTSGWFYNAVNLNIFKGENLNLTVTSNMAYMFCNCDSLTSVDMSMFDTSNVAKMKAMFANDYHLQYIYINEDLWSVEKVLSAAGDKGEGMFYNCYTIKNSEGQPAYDPNCVDAEKANPENGYLNGEDAPEIKTYRYQILYELPDWVTEAQMAEMRPTFPVDDITPSEATSRMVQVAAGPTIYGYGFTKWYCTEDEQYYTADSEVTLTSEVQTKHLVAVFDNYSCTVKGNITTDYPTASTAVAGFAVKLTTSDNHVYETTAKEDGTYELPNVTWKAGSEGQALSATLTYSKANYQTQTKDLTLSPTGDPATIDIETIDIPINKFMVSGGVVPEYPQTGNDRFKGFTVSAKSNDTIPYTQTATYDEISGAYSFNLPYGFTGTITATKDMYQPAGFEITTPLTSAMNKQISVNSKEYKIVFNSNKPEKAEGDVYDFNVTGKMADQDVHFYETLNLTKNSFRIIGTNSPNDAYIFKGWSTQGGEGQTVEYEDQASITNICPAEQSSITLYAVWEKASYNVKVYYLEYQGSEVINDPEKGIKVSETTVDSYKFNETYTYNFKEITGYDLHGESQKSGSLPNYDVFVVFWYDISSHSISGSLVNELFKDNVRYQYSLAGFLVSFEGSRPSPVAGEPDITKKATTQSKVDENGNFVFAFDTTFEYGLNGKITINSLDGTFQQKVVDNVKVEGDVSLNDVVIEKQKRTIQGTVKTD